MTTPPPVLFIFDGDQVKMHHLDFELAKEDDLYILDYFGYAENGVKYKYIITDKASVEVDNSYIFNIV